MGTTLKSMCTDTSNVFATRYIKQVIFIIERIIIYFGDIIPYFVVVHIFRDIERTSE